MAKKICEGEPLEQKKRGRLIKNKEEEEMRQVLEKQGIKRNVRILAAVRRRWKEFRRKEPMESMTIQYS